MDVAELVKHFQASYSTLDQFKAELDRTVWDLTITDDDGNWVTGPNTIHQLVIAMAEQNVSHDVQWEIVDHLKSLALASRK